MKTCSPSPVFVSVSARTGCTDYSRLQSWPGVCWSIEAFLADGSDTKGTVESIRRHYRSIRDVSNNSERMIFTGIDGVMIGVNRLGHSTVHR